MTPTSAEPLLEKQLPRVLLIRGESDTQQALLAWAEASGASVSPCRDLPEALDRHLDEYDALVVDAAVTWSDLSASLERLRIATNGTPLLVITDPSAASGAAAALASGVEDFLVLPYDQGELVARLERLLATPNADSDGVLRFEDIEVDVRDRLCRVDGEGIKLTPKELAILEALMCEAPRTVARHELLEEVWGEDPERGRRALDVHMAHLRQKLAAAYSRTFVATVRGTGFRLAAARVELPTHLVLDAAPDGMLVVDEEGEIVMVNAMLESLFGYERSELVGISLEALIPDRFAARHHRHRVRYDEAPAKRPIDSGLELLAKRRDGTEFPVDISLSPIETHQGRYVIAAVRARPEQTSD